MLHLEVGREREIVKDIPEFHGSGEYPVNIDVLVLEKIIGIGDVHFPES